jgi:ABC-type bacteriocin/lantibiotic exporter with double-glycine peptidase domain
MIDWKIWEFYLEFYSGVRLRLALVTLRAVFQACLLIPLALLVRHIFDRAIPGHDFRSLAFCSLGMLGLYVCSSALILLNRHSALTITKDAIQRIRDELLKKIFRLPRSYYTQADRQQLHDIIVQDTERLDVMSNSLLSSFIPSFLLCGLLIGALIYLDFSLFAVLTALCPILYFSAQRLGRRFHAEMKVFHQKFEDFSSGIAFILRMLDLTRLQTAETSVLSRQMKRHDDLRLTSRGMAWLGTAYGVTQSFIGVTTSVVILLIGGNSVIADRMTLGDLMAFFFALGLLRDQMQNVSQSVPDLIAGSVSLEKLHQISILQEEPAYTGNRKIDFKGGVRLEDVRFGYGATSVLKSINLRIEAGKTYALVGPNGSGKSTIISLVAGLYRPAGGGLFADDIPYETIDMPDLLRRTGVVLQDPMLFPGSILENITFGDAHFTQAEVQRAARIATASEFIEALPLSYQSFLGENGVLLSGGQRQKIALARALIRNPVLLILDEPTNHLDALAVRRIQRNISEQMKAATILIVSHDERVIESCDFAFFLNEGRIAAQGSPASLREQPDYARLFESKRGALHEQEVQAL